VVDGNNHQIETITTLAADYQVKVPILINLSHVTHYLWKAANSFFYTGDPEARAWVRDQTAKILAGKHRDVRAGIRRRATACGYSPADAPAPTNARTTSSTSRTTWTTPPSSPPDGPWPAV
jgi:hypothetical protein